MIGSEFKALNIPVGNVIASPFCRCMDTARIAFGRVTAADEVRGILDGHVILDRAIAARGWYPAVDVVNSLSRVMSRCVTPEHEAAARSVRRLLAAYESKRDLISLGAYKKGGDKNVDQALAALPAIEQLVLQSPADRSDFSATLARLQNIATKYG